MGSKIREIPYCFYRYVLREYERPLGFEDQLEIFRKLEGLEVAYRKANPSESDKDTSLENLGYYLESLPKGKEPVIHFYIAKRISERKTYKREQVGEKRVLKEVIEFTDEYAICRVVALPSRGLMAISDQSGDLYIPANSGINRLATIVRQIQGVRFDYEEASRIEDIKQYMSRFKVHTINFKARYANPSMSAPGDMLHQWLLENNAYTYGNVKAFPDEEGERIIQNPEKGFVGELLGLAQRGYAEIGIDGITSKGYRIKTEKTPRGEEKRYLRVRIYIPFDPLEETEEEHVKNVAQVLIEFSVESL